MAIPFVDVHPQTIAATLAVRSVPEAVTQAVVVILKPRVRTTVMNSVSFALPLHHNNNGFQSCTDADVIMREPEV